jgi:hypothetical protein
MQAAGLQLTRIQLRFENNRAMITVKSNQADVQAYADILFTGTGLLKGYWQVDGRVISHVDKHVVPGQKLTLATPLQPALPTFSEGPHIVMLVINQPVQPIAFPKALYYVTPNEESFPVAIQLTLPQSEAPVDALQNMFKWEAQPKAVHYLIEFIDDNPKRPLFAAITERPEYVLPQTVLKYYFTKNQTYFWCVKGFDASHTLIGESPVWEFILKP